MNDSNHLNIVIIAGVRPQFIKCAALKQTISRLKRDKNFQLDVKYVNTGQHYDREMSGVILDQLDISFDYTITHESKKPIHILANSIRELSDYIDGLPSRPDYIVAMGESNPALVGAIVASQLGIPLAHFEAGTAIDNVVTPEIVNGKIISQLAQIHFCSSRSTEQRILDAKVAGEVYVVGDMNREFTIELAQRMPETFQGQNGNYILLTLHHQENLQSDLVLRNVLAVVSKLKRKTIFVVHPRTKTLIEKWGLTHSLENIEYIPPLSYFEMLTAIKNCAYIFSDSGGVQREAYYLKKRCIIRLDVDFWPDFTSAGIHRKIGVSMEEMYNAVEWAEKVSHEDYPDMSIMPENAIETAMNILMKQPRKQSEKP